MCFIVQRQHFIYIIGEKMYIIFDGQRVHTTFILEPNAGTEYQGYGEEKDRKQR